MESHSKTEIDLKLTQIAICSITSPAKLSCMSGGNHSLTYTISIDQLPQSQQQIITPIKVTNDFLNDSVQEAMTQIQMFNFNGTCNNQIERTPNPKQSQQNNSTKNFKKLTPVINRRLYNVNQNKKLVFNVSRRKILSEKNADLKERSNSYKNDESKEIIQISKIAQIDIINQQNAFSKNQKQSQSNMKLSHVSSNYQHSSIILNNKNSIISQGKVSKLEQLNKQNDKEQGIKKHDEFSDQKINSCKFKLRTTRNASNFMSKKSPNSSKNQNQTRSRRASIIQIANQKQLQILKQNQTDRCILTRGGGPILSRILHKKFENKGRQVQQELENSKSFITNLKGKSISFCRKKDD